MTQRRPNRAVSPGFPVACLAILVLAIAACGSAAAAASPAPSAAPSPSAAVDALGRTASPLAASQPQTIHLILHPVNDTLGSLTGCSTAGSCQGDFMIGYDPLVDADTGTEVGTLAYECFLVDVPSTLYHCPGVTITLTGRGQVVFTELIEHLPR